MVTLDVETYQFPAKLPRRVAERTRHLLDTYGSEIQIKALGKVLPFSMTRDQNGIVNLRCTLSGANDASYNTLSIIISSSDGGEFKDDNALIYEVNRNGELSGTLLMQFALALLRFLGVKSVYLEDSAHDACNDILSLKMILTRGKTFYGRLGFKPVIMGRDNQVGFTSNADKQDRLCKWTKHIQSIRIDDLSEYYNNVIATMTSALKQSIPAKLQIVSSTVGKWDGKPTKRVHTVDVNETLVDKMIKSKILKLRGHSGKTVHDVLSSADCIVFRWLTNLLDGHDAYSVMNAAGTTVASFKNPHAAPMRLLKHYIESQYVAGIVSSP
jgi:hypothetical protein